MDNFPYRLSFDGEKVPNAYLAPQDHYQDIFDATKASLKFESMMNPLQGNHNIRRRRMSSYDISSFFPIPKNDEYLSEIPENIKAEAFPSDYHQSLAHQVQMDNPLEQTLSNRLQEYAVDCYRINRSRGPSFNLGPGRKNSEDLFAHSFDLLNYFRNVEQNEKVFHNEAVDQRVQANFLDEYRNASFMPNVLPGAFFPVPDNSYQFSIHPLPLEMQNSRDFAENHLVEANQELNQTKDRFSEDTIDTREESKAYTELEPKNKKKRKLNNTKEVVKQEAEVTPSLKLKKSKSEIKKELSIVEPQLKTSKSTIGKPATNKADMPKVPKSKKTGAKKGTDEGNAKNEAGDMTDKDGKSTEPSTTNVSPNPKKENIPGVFSSTPGIASAFGHFKKPETAQELLGGMTLPAEVEEYINKSKIFNQIKAPVIRKIGTLTLEERRIKIEKYLEKRKTRSWNKRVNYDCRKKVADNRLRIKGRFVTKEQAFEMLDAYGIAFDPEKITNTEIKDLLNDRFGSITAKKKEGTGAESGEKLGDKNSKSNMKVEDHDEYLDGEQESSSFGSQDSPGENYF